MSQAIMNTKMFPNGKLLRKEINQDESDEIYNQSIQQRNYIHQKLMKERQNSRYHSKAKKKVYKSQYKMQNSPFLVDLVAEQERIDEENKMLIHKQIRQQAYIQNKQRKAKNDLILRALQEENELDALRKEKRQILQEEKRLKTLLDMEKVNSHRKQDRLAAERAERQRKATKAEYRRLKNKEMLDDQLSMKHEMLRIKHNVPSRRNNAFSNNNH